MSTSPEIEIRTAEESAQAKVPCYICRRQLSRYTCPACNVPYCSLSCFRSEAHAQCSETFYRKEIETGIKSESTKTAQERAEMLELLKRMEEERMEEPDLSLYGSVDEDTSDDLPRRLEGLDIRSAPTDELLRRLTKEERDRFFSALRDPASELAQQLIASTELEQGSQAPWWESPSVQDGDSVLYERQPSIMDVPSRTIRWNPGAPSLLYNICAMLIAYTYTTRHLSMSPLASSDDLQDRSEARRLIASAVPFIADRQSRVLHATLSDAMTSVWGRLDHGSVDPVVMGLLLKDVAQLVRPRKVVVADNTTSNSAWKQGLTPDHPSAPALMALSDLRLLFDDATTESHQPAGNHVTMKITFYAGHLLATPPFFLDALADEALVQSRSVSAKKVAQGGPEGRIGVGNTEGRLTKPKIVEIKTSGTRT